MTDDLYAGFAERYDLFFPRFGEHDLTVVEFYRRLFAENRVQRVLDCAFRTVDFYGTYRFDSYDKETSYRLITAAYK